MKSSRYLSAVAALALVALASIATLSAGQQPFKWWQSDHYKKELGLTPEQTRRMEEIFQKAMPQLKVQKSALDEAEAKFERLVERGEDAAVMDQINVVEAARAELNKGRTLMLYGMRKVMTGNQWAKFTALHQAATQQQQQQQQQQPPPPSSPGPERPKQ
jgi:Spy/CpxP family protein refolding chaperone